MPQQPVIMRNAYGKEYADQPCPVCLRGPGQTCLQVRSAKDSDELRLGPPQRELHAVRRMTPEQREEYRLGMAKDRRKQESKARRERERAKPKIEQFEKAVDPDGTMDPAERVKAARRLRHDVYRAKAAQEQEQAANAKKRGTT